MAIQLEYINVIVQLEKIREKLGDEALKNRFLTSTDTCWHDRHLFREGCMNEYDLDDILDGWEEEGLELLTVVDGKKYWKDLCVVHSGHGPSYPCEWIEYDREKNIVWLKGTEPGPVAGPPGRN
jgi:hypothetical protein